MNFDNAIRVHSDWKQKLASYIRKPDHSLNSSETANDRSCDLGKWIYGEGAQHSSLPEFAKMKQSHAAFHRAAADVIRKADSGQKVTDEIALGASTPYASSSSEVIGAIMHLQAKLRA